MHWILTILITIGGHTVIDHQEYFNLHNCQEAAMLLHKQNEGTMAGYSVYDRYACTASDDMSPTYK